MVVPLKATNLKIIKQLGFISGVDLINALLQTVTSSWPLYCLTENIFWIENGVWKSSKGVAFTVKATNLKIIIYIGPIIVIYVISAFKQTFTFSLQLHSLTWKAFSG